MYKAILLGVLCVAGVDQQSANLAATSNRAALISLAQEVTDKSAHLQPLLATELGVPGEDGALLPPTEASRAAYVEQLRIWQARLAAIAAGFAASTSLVERDDVRLLDAQLTTRLDELLIYERDRKDYSKSGTDVLDALYTQLRNLPVAGREGATPRDVHRAWEDITSRLEKTPAYIAAARKLVTMPCRLYGAIGGSQLAGAPELLNGPLSEAARNQLRANTADFKRFVKARDAAVAALSDLKTYIDSHVSSWPDNYTIKLDVYEAMLRNEDLLPFSAADIDRIGEDALAHGWAEESWLRSLSEHTSQPLGAPSGGGLLPTEGTAVIDYYRRRVEELRKFVQDSQIVTVPQWLGTLQVIETPDFMRPVLPTPAMDPPRLFSPSTTGYYYVVPPVSVTAAAARLDPIEAFDRDRVLFTSAHESIPGHFLQGAIARNHPDLIRKLANSPSFIEGWAFYGQEMLVRLGLYGADLDARLDAAAWERIDGAVAIADPKLATGEWSPQQTADFLRDQAGLLPEVATGIVNLMLSRPGYVVAYAAGRLQIEKLLGDYNVIMGRKASLHDFHDRLLSYGAAPLAIIGPELLAGLDKSAAEIRAAAGY
jgi:hypothetical protein